MQLSDLLDVVRNEKLYTKRIEELERVEAEANLAIANLTKAKNLDIALADAKRTSLAADEILKQAREKSVYLSEEAERKAADIISQAKQTASTIDGDLSGKKSELDGLFVRLTRIKQELENAQILTAKAKSEYDEIVKRSEELREEIKSKQDKLKALMA